MAKLTCIKPFDIGVQKISGIPTEIKAEIGDTVEVNVRNRNEFFIIAVYKPTGKVKVFSTWLRQNWVKAHCN